jgi:hypothetical protein
VGFNKSNECVPIYQRQRGAYPNHKLSGERTTIYFKGRKNTCAEEGSADPLHVHVL